MSEMQRQFPRYPLLLCADTGDGWRDWTENVSESGVFVLSDDMPPEGTSRTLRLGFPGVVEPFEITGNVAWVRPASAWQPSGYGIALGDGVPAVQEIAKACASAAQPSRSTKVLMIRVAFGAGQVGAGIELVTQNDTEAAVSYARENPGVLVVSSIYPPLTECLSTLKEIRRAGATAVFCIASGDTDDDARALAAGADALLPRPLTVGPLLTSLGCLLRL